MLGTMKTILRMLIRECTLSEGNGNATEIRALAETLIAQGLQDTPNIRAEIFGSLTVSDINILLSRADEGRAGVCVRRLYNILSENKS